MYSCAMKILLACNFLDVHSAQCVTKVALNHHHHQCNESQGISRNIRNSCNNYDMLEFTLIARHWSHGRAEVVEDDDC